MFGGIYEIHILKLMLFPINYNMKQIKILHIIDHLQETGGAEKRLLNDIEHLNKKIFSNEIFCTINCNDKPAEKLENKNTPVHVSSKKNIFLKIFELINIINQAKPDIVHTQLFYSDILGRMAARICKVPAIISTVQSSVHEPSAKFYYSKLRRFADMLTIRFCTRIIAVSEFVKQSISKRLFVNKDKITVIHNYVYKLKIKQKKVNKNTNETIFCCTGKLVRAKGQLELIEAISKVIKDNADNAKIKLMLAGDGPYRDACEKRASDLGIKAQIMFLGNANNINELLEKSDAFVFPTHSEGLSVALLEAVFAKKTCIISSIPPNLEIIDSKNCITFIPQNEEAIYTAIKEFMLLNKENPEKLKAMADEAYNHAVKKFNPNACVKKLEEVYTASYNTCKGD